MLLCVPIAPFFLSLTPHPRSSSQIFAWLGRHFLRSRRRDPEIGIFSRPRRLGARVGISSSNDEYQARNNAHVEGFVRKRKIVEHILLLQAKMELSDVNEKDMLDFLYTSQYFISGIIAISLGRVEDLSMDNITHAVYMRFQTREDLARFSANPHFLKILKEHVYPYCYVCPDMDHFLSILNLK